MKKTILVTTFILFFTFIGFGKKLADLPELMKPSRVFFVDDTQIYIPEGAVINIYSKKNYKLIKKFGKSGEGPKEFRVVPQLPLSIDAQGKNLVIFSLGKVSYFTKQGEFIKEIKTSSQVFSLMVYGDKFIGRSRKQDKSVVYDTINLYDSTLNKIKELARNRSAFQGIGKGLEVLGKPFLHSVYKNKILLIGKDDATIDIFNGDMKKLRSIKLDGKKISMKQDFKDKVIDLLKNGEATKSYFSIFKPIRFPDYFPIIAAFFVDNNVIYVLTWTKNPNEYGCSIFGIDGKFVKNVSIPIKFQDSLTPYPIAIHNGVLYQIVENDEDEMWELHASEIK